MSGYTSVMCPVAGQLMVCTDIGIIHRVSWSGVFDGNLSIHLSALPFSNDLYPESRGIVACPSLSLSIPFMTHFKFFNQFYSNYMYMYMYVHL